VLTLGGVPLIAPIEDELFADLEPEVTLDASEVRLRRLEDLQREVRLNIPVEWTCPWTQTRYWPGPGLTQIAFPTGFEPPKEPTLQVFRFPPWGASRFAHGWFLASTNQVNALQQVAFASNGASVAVPLVMDAMFQRSGESISTNVYVLSMTPLMRCLPSDSDPYVNGLYLLTLVDERFFWWGIPSPVFNIGNNTVPPITPPPAPTPVAWTDLINLCVTALGEPITFDPIPSAYLVPNTNLNVNYEVLPPVIDAIAANIGMRFVRGLGGNLSFQSWATATTIVATDQANNPLRTYRAGSFRFDPQL
jgi:hypothetical protein